MYDAAAVRCYIGTAVQRYRLAVFYELTED